MKTKTYLIVSIALLMGVSAWAQEPVTISIYNDCSKNGKTEDIRSVGEENGYAWVDLGLPSGLKWASCNVGATTSEESGNYYAWGETTPKDKYWWTNYKYAADGNCCKDACNCCHLTKYCNNAIFGENGFTDRKTTLVLDDDAAHVNWGGSWRMPTSVEVEELYNNCTWTWTTQNGVNGYLVASKTNSNSIFLPAYKSNSFGAYWSSSLNTSKPDSAWPFYLYSNHIERRANQYRYIGYTVRPVCP